MDFGAHLLERLADHLHQIQAYAWVLEHSPSLGTAPWVIWAGLGLWLVMRLADGAQGLGGLRTTAYWWCGAVLAMLSLFAVWAPSLRISNVSWLFDVALGWMLYCLGQRIDPRWLIRNKALTLTALAEFALTCCAVGWVLMELGVSTLTACLVGVIAAHSSPVILISFMPQWRADGQISARALHVGCINTLIATICLPLLISLGQSWQQATTKMSTLAPQLTAGSMPASVMRSGWELVHPLFILALAMLIGLSLGKYVAYTHQKQQKYRQKTNRTSWPGCDSLRLLAAVCICVGLSQWCDAPTWAACLALGLGQRPVDTNDARMVTRLYAQQTQTHESIDALAQLVLFSFSAMALTECFLRNAVSFTDLPSALAMMIPLLAVLALLRLCSKLMVCTMTARWAGLRWQQGFALGLMLQPISMTGLALLLMAMPLLMPSDALLTMSLVLTLMLSDWLSPMILRHLLRRCNELASTDEEAIDLPQPTSRNSAWPTRINQKQQEIFDQRVRDRLKKAQETSATPTAVYSAQ